MINRSGSRDESGDSILAEEKSDIVRDAEISIQNEDGGFIGAHLTKNKVMFQDSSH